MQTVTGCKLKRAENLQLLALCLRLPRSLIARQHKLLFVHLLVRLLNQSHGRSKQHTTKWRQTKRSARVPQNATTLKAWECTSDEFLSKARLSVMTNLAAECKNITQAIMPNWLFREFFCNDCSSSSVARILRTKLKESAIEPASLVCQSTSVL